MSAASTCDAQRSARRARAVALDRDDPLRDARARFALPEGVIYLDGNSLGPLPRATRERVRAAVDHEWGEGLIRSWNDAGWIDLPRRVGDTIAPLIGARAGECIACDSTSVNLFKVLSAAIALRARGTRTTIVSERGNFPTDVYIAQGLAAQHPEVRLRLVDGDLREAIDERCAVVMLTHVNYQTGAMHDMAALTRHAHDAGALVIWDLAHSAGAVPVDLHAADADFAVGCGYKYLNGGPGAPAFVWVHPRHADDFVQPLSGWLGHASPFTFSPTYAPAPGVMRAQVGTPPVLSMIALECGVASIADLGIARLRAKSLALCDLFIETVEAEVGGDRLALVTPRAHAARASQVAWRPRGELAAHAYAVMQASIARGVIGDFRAEIDGPGILRFGFAPAYVRYVDAFDAAVTLAEVIAQGEYRDVRHARRAAVT